MVCVDGVSVVTSALGPFDASQPSGFSHLGHLGDELDLVDGRRAAATAATAILEALTDRLGSLDLIAQVLTLRGYLATTAEFIDHATVMDEASETIIAALGERGRHTRTTIGAASLPFGVPLVLELTARLQEGGVE